MATHNPEEVYHAAPRGRENRASLNHPGWPLTRGTDDDGASPSREGRGHPWGLEGPIGGRGGSLCYLARHASGDWGDLDEGDRRENMRSLRHG
jgi:hypothetical protein